MPRWLWWIIGALVIWWVIQNPAAAGNLVHQVFTSAGLFASHSTQK